jgi:hypothetical protein
MLTTPESMLATVQSRLATIDFRMVAVEPNLATVDPPMAIVDSRMVTGLRCQIATVGSRMTTVGSGMTAMGSWFTVGYQPKLRGPPFLRVLPHICQFRQGESTVPVREHRHAARDGCVASKTVVSVSAGGVFVGYAVPALERLVRLHGNAFNVVDDHRFSEEIIVPPRRCCAVGSVADVIDCDWAEVVVVFRPAEERVDKPVDRDGAKVLVLL